MLQNIFKTLNKSEDTSSSTVCCADILFLLKFHPQVILSFFIIQPNYFLETLRNYLQNVQNPGIYLSKHADLFSVILNGSLDLYVDRMDTTNPSLFCSLLHSTLEQSKKETNLRSYIRNIKKPVICCILTVDIV